MNVRILTLLFVLSCVLLKAQDIHFTQVQASPLVTNPAFTGWFTGDCRIGGIYREQWSAIDIAPYKTFGLSYEKQQAIYTEQLNYGILLVHDNSGTIGLTSNLLALSASYKKEINGHKIQAGIQCGIVNTAVNVDDITFDSQFDVGENSMFNSDILSGENLQNSTFYIDFNAGALWSKRISASITPVVGFAFFHINNPNKSIYNIETDETQVPIRTVLHAGVEYIVTKKLTVIPAIIHTQQNQATEILLGGNVEYAINQQFIDVAYAGTMCRYGYENNYDATAFIIGFKYNGFDFAYSYDYNISTLQEATSNKGAFELSLRYTCKSTKVQRVKVSCDRL